MDASLSRFVVASVTLLAIGCGSSSSTNVGDGSSGGSPPGSGTPAANGSSGTSGTSGSSGTMLPACSATYALSPVVELDTSGNGGPPAIAWTGTSYAVTWNNAPQNGVPTQPLSFATIAMGATTASSRAMVAANGTDAQLAATGSGFVAIYAINQGGLVSQALGAAGTPSGKETPLAGDPQGVRPISIASSGKDVLAVWEGINVIHHEVVGGALKEQFGGNSDGIGAPSNAVWTGDRFAMAWRGYAVGPTGVYLGEVAADGTAGDYTVVWPPEADTMFGGGAPSLSWTGSEYRLAWVVGDQLFTTRVPRGGAADAPSMAKLATLPNSQVIWDGTGYGGLMASGADGAGLSFVRFAANGTPIGAPIVIDAKGGNSRLIHTGREYALAWSRADRVAFARFGGCP